MSNPKQDTQEPGKKATITALSEEERLRQDIYRPDKEKFQLLVQMFRNNALYKRAKITHK